MPFTRHWVIKWMQLIQRESSAIFDLPQTNFLQAQSVCCQSKIVAKILPYVCVMPYDGVGKSRFHITKGLQRLLMKYWMDRIAKNAFQIMQSNRS